MGEMKKKPEPIDERQVTIEAYELTEGNLRIVARRAEAGEMFSRLFDENGNEIYRTEVL